MVERLKRWFDTLPYADALERRQAGLLQGMEASIALVACLLTPQTLLNPGGAFRAIYFFILLFLIFVSALLAIALLRRGRLQASALTMAAAIIVSLSMMLYSNSIERGGLILFAYALPIVIGGMLAGRRGIILTVLGCVAGVALTLFLTAIGAPGAGFARETSSPGISSLISFTALAGLLGLFINGLNSLAREALAARKARELELQALSAQLEQTVQNRTSDLESALVALEFRAGEAERLLAENARQREAIRTLSVPVMPIGRRTLVMPLVGELDTERLEEMQVRALEAIETQAARQLMIDITGVVLIDTYVAQGLMRVVYASRLLGAEVSLVGVRPEVAQAIVGLGIDFGLLRAYPDLETALR
jgi:rsbT co-antagonist protein RsbR